MEGRRTGLNNYRLRQLLRHGVNRREQANEWLRRIPD